MPDTYTVQPREVVGKAVAGLRREGMLPANIYGRGIESTPVQLPYIEARDLLNEHGRNTLINLQVEGEARARPVVVRQIAQNPVTRSLLHLDFYQVDLGRVTQAQVPVTLTGEAPAVARWGGVLVQQLDHVMVEALPRDLPEHIEVPVGGLEELEQHMTLADIRAPRGVRILTDAESTVVVVQRPRVLEEPEIVAEGEQPAEEDAPAT